MPPKSKANGAGAKATKPEKATPSASGTSTPIPDGGAAASGGSFGKPDKAAYDTEQDQLRKKIDEIQTKLVRPLIRTVLLVAHATIVSLYSLPSRTKSPMEAVMMLPLHAKGSSRASWMSCADNRPTTRTLADGSSTNSRR
jgi:hypothetical protein